MVNEKDRSYKPAKRKYIQKIIFVFNDGNTFVDINKTYWARYTMELKAKIVDHLEKGFTIGSKSYTANDIESITILYPE